MAAPEVASAKIGKRVAFVVVSLLSVAPDGPGVVDTHVVPLLVRMLPLAPGATS